MTARLTDLYVARGYFLTRATIEPQDVSQGALRIRIVEGHIAEVKIVGAGLERYRLQEALARLTAERPLKFARFERDLLLASDAPGLQITDTNLEELPGQQGSYRLTVKAVASPVSAALTIDNRVSEGLAKLQALSAISFSSIVLPRDDISLAVATTARGPRELAFIGGGYDVQVGNTGVSLGAFGSHSYLAPGDMRRAVDMETRTDIAGVKIGYVALRSLEQNLRFSLALTSLHAEETTNAGLSYEDRIAAATLGANYQAIDRYGGINVLQVNARRGFDIGSASERWSATTSRYDASGVFTKSNFFATRYQPLGERWYVRSSAAGQISADPLLNAEQFYLGDAQFGRAYSSGRFGGDHGVALALEAGMLLPWRNDVVRRTEVFGFLDGGFVGYRGHEYEGHTSILSTGAGWRATLGENHTAQVELALPIDVGSTDERGGRVFFSITSSFQGCGYALGC